RERRPQAVERRNDDLGEDRGASATLDERAASVLTDDRETPKGRRLPGEFAALVADKDGARRREGPGKGSPTLGGRGHEDGGGHGLKGTDACSQPKQAEDLRVDEGLIDVARAHRREKRVAPGSGRTGHGEILRMPSGVDAAHRG